MKTPIAVLLLTVAFGAAAQDKACSPADMKKAEQATDRVVSWETLYKAWQEYRHCDKGPVDENFTDATLRLIVDWKKVETFAKQMESDKEYRDFIHRHVSSPAAKGDVDAVFSRAKMNCPKGYDNFCKDLATTAKPFAGLEITTTAAPAAPGAPAATPAAVPAAAEPKK